MQATINTPYALWINKEGEFGIMDTAKGAIYKPIIDHSRSVRAQQIGLDHELNPISTVTFVATANPVRKEVDYGLSDQRS